MGNTIVGEPSWAGKVWDSDTTGTGNFAANTGVYISPCAGDEPKKQPAPLAWLNSRVDDMVERGKQALEAA